MISEMISVRVRRSVRRHVMDRVTVHRVVGVRVGVSVTVAINANVRVRVRVRLRVNTLSKSEPLSTAGPEPLSVSSQSKRQCQTLGATRPHD